MIARRIVLAARAGLALAASTTAVLAGVAVALPASAQVGVTPQQIGQVFDRLYAKYSRNVVGMCVGAVDSGIDAAKCYGTKRPG